MQKGGQLLTPCKVSSGGEGGVRVEGVGVLRKIMVGVEGGWGRREGGV